MSRHWTLGSHARLYGPVLVLDPGSALGLLLLPELGHAAAEQVHDLIVATLGNSREWLQPLFRRGDAEGSTDNVRCDTLKPAIETVRSHVSHDVVDAPHREE